MHVVTGLKLHRSGAAVSVIVCSGDGDDDDLLLLFFLLLASASSCFVSGCTLHIDMCRSCEAVAKYSESCVQSTIVIGVVCAVTLYTKLEFCSAYRCTVPLPTPATSRSDDGESDNSEMPSVLLMLDDVALVSMLLITAALTVEYSYMMPSVDDA